MLAQPRAIDADVAVVGGGPAGVAAAAIAAECGSSVVLIDEQPRIGGQIWRHGVATRPSPDAARWLDRLASSGAHIESGTAVFDAEWLAPSGRFELRAVHEGRAVCVRSARVVICTGARERYLPFPGWTLPGVVGIGGAQALIKSGADVRGKRVVVAGSGPLLLPVAALIAGAGAHLALVAEQAPRWRVARLIAGMWRTPAVLSQAARYRRAFAQTRYAPGRWVTRAEGRDCVERVVVTDGQTEWVLPCDMLCTGYGLVPETRLAALLGCSIDDGAIRVDAAQRTSVPGVFAAGEPTGIGGGAIALVEGETAGYSSGGRHDAARSRARLVNRARRSAQSMDRAFELRAELRMMATPDTIVCRCEDVPIGSIDPGAGFRRARLHCRLGMGACQGRVCGDALSWLEGWPPEPPRVPLVPVPLGVLGIEQPTATPKISAGV